MKTPDDIKSGLIHCYEDGCKQCPYKEDCDMADGFSVLASDANAYIQQLENNIGKLTEKVSQLEAAQPKWIIANMPPERWKENDKDGTLVNYIVYSPDYGVDIGNYVKPAKMWVIMGLPAKVTHWMPMPEPPKEETHE